MLINNVIFFNNYNFSTIVCKSLNILLQIYVTGCIFDYFPCAFFNTATILLQLLLFCISWVFCVSITEN